LRTGSPQAPGLTAAAAQKVIDALRPELDELTKAIKILAAKAS
jgi:hypothetical protein